MSNVINHDQNVMKLLQKTPCIESKIHAALSNGEILHKMQNIETKITAARQWDGWKMAKCYKSRTRKRARPKKCGSLSAGKFLKIIKYL